MMHLYCAAFHHPADRVASTSIHRALNPSLDEDIVAVTDATFFSAGLEDTSVEK